jgi:hypothetical protein
MTFRDPQLEQHYRRVVSLNGSSDVAAVCALLDAWHRFHLLEGDDSPQTREALELLLSSELRPALRSWYSRQGDDMNPAALEFRQRLGGMAGEKLG